jgi:hypothetical protein
MTLRFTDAIFWISALCCAAAQLAILRSVVVAPVRITDGASTSVARRAIDIVWAVLPGVALVAVFVLTWRVMHGGHAAVVPPNAQR